MPRGNDGSDTARNRTRTSWWNAGHVIDNDDHANSTWNLGLGRRERQALSDENSRPYGLFGPSQRAISDRGREAQRRGRVQKSRGWFSSGGKKQAPSGWFGSNKRMVEKRRGGAGMWSTPSKSERKSSWF